tara:strand:- start:83 stop:316 length:234 start_codon:yes stop_codon:yes gene_type:complete
MSQNTGKTITIDNSEGSVSSVTVEQRTPEGGLEVGGMKLDTSLPWYGDAFIILFLGALIYVLKKYIDIWFSEKRKIK